MTLLISAYCGLESPELSPTQCRERLSNLAARHLPDGHTLIEADGCWLSPERGIVQEPTLILQAIGGEAERQAVLTVARLYRLESFQDAVFVATCEVGLEVV